MLGPECPSSWKQLERRAGVLGESSRADACRAPIAGRDAGRYLPAAAGSILIRGGGRTGRAGDARMTWGAGERAPGGRHHAAAPGFCPFRPWIGASTAGFTA